MTEQTLAAVARRFLEAYGRGDVTAMAAACAVDARFDYVPLGDAGKGRIAQDAVPVWQSYVNALEGFHPEIVDVWEDVSQRTAIVATVNRGVHVRDVDGIVARGRALAVPHLFIFKLDASGAISSIRAYWDTLTIFSQIGFPEGFSASLPPP